MKVQTGVTTQQERQLPCLRADFHEATAATVRHIEHSEGSCLVNVDRLVGPCLHHHQLFPRQQRGLII